MGGEFDSITKQYLKKNAQLPLVYGFEFEDKHFIGFNDVFSPSVFEDSYYFASILPRIKIRSFLEIGCGTGMISIVQALHGATVTACDINESAVKNTMTNAYLHKVEDKITAIKSDVFSNIENYHQFDLVFWNMPFIYSDSLSHNILDHSCFSYQYQSIGEFFRGAKEIIKNGGEVYYGFSIDSGDEKAINKLLKINKLRSQIIGSKCLSLPEEPYFSVAMYRLSCNEC